MNRNADKKLDDLFRAARGFLPDTSHREDHFETRLLVRIHEKRSFLSTWLTWERRLVPAFAVLAIVLGIMAWITDSYRSPDVLASLINNREHQIITRYLTGG